MSILLIEIYINTQLLFYMNDAISIASSLLDDEMKAKKKKDENYAIGLSFFVQLIGAFNGLQLKTYPKFFPKTYSHNSLAFWRFSSMTLIGYFICKKKNIDIPSIPSIKIKFWFFARNLGIYTNLILWILMTQNLRLSTCQCISGCHPILVLYMSIFFLKEKFYMRYLAGIFLCIVGTLIIVLNEKNVPNDSENNTTLVNTDGNMFFGLFYGMASLIVFSIATLAQKFLCKEKMGGEVQNFYMGSVNSSVALVLIIFDNYTAIHDLVYIAYCASNAVVFYVTNYYTAECLKYIPLSKYIPITYMGTVFIFMISCFILGEPIYFTDLLGSLLIVSFQIYNAWVPLK